MSDIRVTDDPRKKARQLEKVFNNDIRKIITEIVTNSDDSYRRLLKDENLQGVQPIYIELDLSNKDKQKVIITDNAEGMHEDDMDSKFGVYGSDKSGRSKGHKTRGMFGQGVHDVMFYASNHTKDARIISIKDGEIFECKFIVDKEYNKDIKARRINLNKNELDKFRVAYNITKNGTRVEFSLPSNVKINKKTITNELKNFYMLRFIFADNNRSIHFKFNNQYISSKLKYQFPIDSESTPLVDKDFSFSYENNRINCHLTLYHNDNLDDSVYGEQKILCYDDKDNENIVYDNTMFQYQKQPGADKAYGYLKLTDTSRIFHDKLNSIPPLEILTDTRSGFNTDISFYKNLDNEIDKILKPIFLKLASRHSEKDIDLGTKSEWQDVIKVINKHFKENLDEDIGGGDVGVSAPAEGLKFARSEIKITLSKQYSLRLLINTDIIPVGSKIVIENLSGLSINPIEFLVTNNMIKNDNLAIKTLAITGNETLNNTTVSATYSGITAQVLVSVINEDVHYPKIMDFYKDKLQVKPGINSKAHLYIDCNAIELGSKIQLSTDTEMISLKNDQYILEEDHIKINDLNIAVIDCEFTGLKDGAEGSIFAKVNRHQASAYIKISEKDPPPQGNSGFLSGIEATEYPDAFWQSSYNPNNHVIMINISNTITKAIIGEVKLDNKGKFKISKDQHKYFAELCSNEAAKNLVKRLEGFGQVNGTDDIMDEIQKQKNEIFNLMLVVLHKII